MPPFRDAGSAKRNVEHSAMLDQFPELWVEIIRLVPELDRLRHVPLVCHRFNKACREPSTWPQLNMIHESIPTESRWQSFLRWLAVRASGLQSFTLTPDYQRRFGGCVKEAAHWEMRTPELITLLVATAPQLQSLHYSYPGPSPGIKESALPAALSQFSQLTSISISAGYAHVTTAQVDAMVQGLPSLQFLDLRGGSSFLADGFPVGIATGCSQLQSLCIIGGFPEGVPQELGRLTKLTALMLGNRCASLPASISHLTRLLDVAIYNNYSETELPEQLWHLESIIKLTLHADIKFLPGSISRLTALHNLNLNLSLSHAYDFALPLGLTACQQLTGLTLGSDAASPVLARLQSLRMLMVIMLPSQLPHSTHWTQLTGLTHLILRVSGCNVSQYSGLSGMTSLQKLVLSGGSGLPEGPYLSRLQSLVLKERDNEAGIPPALQGAARLQNLCITPPNGLNNDDVAALVISLPAALKTLTIGYDADTVTAEELSQRVSHLRVQRSLPRAVYHQ